MFPYLLLPSFWAARNRMRRRQKGDTVRGVLFGAVGLGVAAAIFAVVFWLTWQLLDYAELGDYLVRLGLSWLFLTFLSFLTFSGIVTALSTFFLSEDLRLVLVAPIPIERHFYARFTRTVAQASWMVVTFLLPVLLAVGLARCAGPLFYATSVLALVPFCLIPVALGSVVTLTLVNVFPARRARDVLMLMGLVFAGGLVVMLRVFLRPERLLSVTSLPDVTAFFATLQSPVTPLLPSFWAGESIFASVMGVTDWMHLGALWTTAGASVVLARMAFSRWYFDGWSKAQEARKARFTRFQSMDRVVSWLPLPLETRTLLVKDAKIFLRDTTQWSQLLLLVALMLVYLYNFKVLDLDRIPYMSRVIKNVYAFVNMAMASFVLSAVAVRFVFPSVSAEGAAFWIVRSSPVDMRRFLWSKFWIGVGPVMVLAVALTVVSNQFLGAAPFLKWVTAISVVFMTLALVGLAAGMGAMYPRFNAENLTQVAGSYGGISFMIVAVMFILVTIGLVAWPSTVYLWFDYRGLRIPTTYVVGMAASFGAAVGLSLYVWREAMRRGVAALDALG